MVNAGENIIKGNYGKALLNLGGAAFDVYSMGGASLLKLGVKEVVFKIAFETGENVISDRIGFSPRLLKDGLKNAVSNSITHGHHTFPKFLGGPAKQLLANLDKQLHRDLHSDLNRFLAQIRKKTAINMVPSSVNSGRQIIQNVAESDRVNAIKDFYKEYSNKYPEAAKTFQSEFGHLY